MYIYICMFLNKNTLIYHKYFGCFQNLLQCVEGFENNRNICDKSMCFYLEIYICMYIYI